MRTHRAVNTLAGGQAQLRIALISALDVGEPISSTLRPFYLSRRTYYKVKNAVFWDVTPCGCCKNRRSPILVTLMMEALSFSETLVLTTPTRHNIPEDDILHSDCRENLKSYIALTGWTL
jgi:hypothetical protein